MDGGGVSLNLGNPIASGTADIYLYDNKVVKVFNDYLPEMESIFEANKQKQAYSCGLPVPEIFNVTKVNGKQATIMEYVEGRTLGNLLLEDMEQAEYYFSISVDVQQKIHSIIPDTIEPMFDKLSRQIVAAPILETSQKSHLLKKLK